MKTIKISDLTASTYSVKDDSPRGCRTANRNEVKEGDYVVIDNYFTLVVADECNKTAVETEVITKCAEDTLKELKAEFENPKCEQHSTHIKNLIYLVGKYHTYADILSDNYLEGFLRVVDRRENKKLVDDVNKYIEENY